MSEETMPYPPGPNPRCLVPDEKPAPSQPITDAEAEEMQALFRIWEEMLGGYYPGAVSVQLAEGAGRLLAERQMAVNWISGYARSLNEALVEADTLKAERQQWQQERKSLEELHLKQDQDLLAYQDRLTQERDGLKVILQQLVAEDNRLTQQWQDERVHLLEACREAVARCVFCGGTNQIIVGDGSLKTGCDKCAGLRTAMAKARGEL